MFVDEDFRGNRISRQLIECAAGYAKEVGFTKVYIPSGITGLYEKYGFQKIDVLINYGGDTDKMCIRDRFNNVRKIINQIHAHHGIDHIPAYGP